MNITVPIIIRRNMLKEVVGISPSAVDKLEKAGEFPARRHITEGIVGWYGPDVVAWAAKHFREDLSDVPVIEYD